MHIHFHINTSKYIYHSFLKKKFGHMPFIKWYIPCARKISIMYLFEDAYFPARGVQS